LDELHGEIYTYPSTTLGRASESPPEGGLQGPASVLFVFSGVCFDFRVIWFDFQVVGKVVGICFGALWVEMIEHQHPTRLRRPPSI
jgi:hypothetical protein